MRRPACSGTNHANATRSGFARKSRRARPSSDRRGPSSRKRIRTRQLFPAHAGFPKSARCPSHRHQCLLHRYLFAPRVNILSISACLQTHLATLHTPPSSRFQVPALAVTPRTPSARRIKPAVAFSVSLREIPLTPQPRSLSKPKSSCQSHRSRITRRRQHHTPARRLTLKFNHSPSLARPSIDASIA